MIKVEIQAIHWFLWIKWKKVICLPQRETGVILGMYVIVIKDSIIH
jgi:hypothetical protein